MKPLQLQIDKKIREALKPEYFELINESHQHASGPDAETHFKLICVSSLWDSESTLDRHRQIFQLLANELEGGVHALSLHLFSPEQWKSSREVQSTPACRGGTT